MFQHTAARRRLDFSYKNMTQFFICFNTQPPEGGWQRRSPRRPIKRRFNTQPPEGGWNPDGNPNGKPDGFNTQPPEGGWATREFVEQTVNVSTHSRPKAAGI